MTKVRLIRHHGESWASVEDLRLALKDDDMITRAAAMLKVAREKGDEPLETVRKAITYFFTEGAGILAHLEN